MRVSLARRIEDEGKFIKDYAVDQNDYGETESNGGTATLFAFEDNLYELRYTWAGDLLARQSGKLVREDL